MKKQRRSPWSAARSADFPPFVAGVDEKEEVTTTKLCKIKIDCNSDDKVVLDEDGVVVVEDVC